MITFEPTYLKSIAFAIVLRVRKSPKFRKVSKAMVDACVYVRGHFLVETLGVWRFSNLTRMPTFLCVSVNNGNHYKENR